WKYTHLDVDRPGIVMTQLLDRFEAAHLHTAIQLQMRAHSRCAMLDALLQCAAGTLIDVLDGKRLLDRGDALHRIGFTPLLRRAAVDDVGLVQVDVRLDKTPAGETAACVVLRSI